MSHHRQVRQLRPDWACFTLIQRATTSDRISFGYSLIVGHWPCGNRNYSFSNGVAVAEEEIFGREVEFVDVCQISNTVCYLEH